METDGRKKGIAFAFFGMLGISTDSFFIRLADVGGFDITFWIGVFTAIVTFATSQLVHGINPIDAIRSGGWPLWLGAGMQALSTSAFVLAVTHTSVSNVVVIVAAAPMFAAGLSALLLGERTSRRVWIAIALVISGVVVVVSGSLGQGQVLGDLFALGAIFLFGCSLVLLRRFPDINRTLMVGLGGIGMSLIAVIPAALSGYSGTTWIALVLMGAVFGPISRVVLAIAPRYLPAAEVGLFTPVETVAASLWAWLFFAEAPVLTTYIGGAIVVGAVIWGIRQPKTLAKIRT